MKKLIPLASLFLFTSANLFAQEAAKKLKDVQVNSVLAPSPVKIDGRLREWSEFQAYNKGTHLYYTVANDEKNLYLIIKTSDQTASAKITAGGITLLVNTDGKKKEQGAYTLTYPIIPRNGGRAGGPGGGGMRMMTFGGGAGTPGKAAGPDSAMIKAMHERTINGAKEIKVSGFKEITDSLIAIYNEYNIKAAINYDDAGAFIYELAVPLKLMGLSVNDSKEFAYNIKLNGLQLNFRMPDGADGSLGGGGGPGGGGMRIVNLSGPPGGGRGGIDFQDLTSPGDFWGSYTLAKK